MNPENNYLLKTCLRCYRTSWECQHIEKDYYYSYYSDIFLNIILNAERKVLMENGNHIAFKLFSNDTLHFVYVRKFKQGQGLALNLIKPLIKENKIKISFKTKDFITKFSDKLKVSYTPFARYIK